MKRVLSLLLTAMLMVGLIPAGLAGTANAASTGTFFVFPNENYSVGSARVVNTDEVNLTGTINNVNGDISYSVYQIAQNSSNDWEVVNSNVGQTGGITLDGFKLTVMDVQLYSGMNKITFKGTNGAKSVEDTIYIEFRNGPTLSNLQASMSGQTVDLSEGSTAVLTAAPKSANFGKDSADIIISGIAKNAQSVMVTVNDKSWTYKVSSYNDYKFTASSIKVNEGKNLITITATNGDQSVETTRELAFNNGESTFYDLYLNHDGDNTKSPDLATSPDFSVSSVGAGDIVLTGKAIVPVTDGDFTVDYTFSGGATGTGSVDAEVESTDADGGYTVISYEIDVPAAAFDDTVKVQLEVNNEQPDGSVNTVGEHTAYFTLRDNSEPYIYAINYLDGYSGNTSASQALNLTGTATSPTKYTDVYSLPAGFEVLVINGTNSTDVELDSITDSKGNKLTGGDLDVVTRKSSVQTINGVQTDVMRIIVEMSELPADGSQLITLSVGDSKKTVAITLLYGPYAQFDKLYDGQQISIDTTNTDMKKDILKAVGNFSGTLFNIPNTDTIVYSGGNRTVYLYVNNTLVDLEQDGSKTEFKVDEDDEDTAAGAMITGSNTIKLVYKSGTSSYTKSVSVNLIQTNVPEIPVEDTLGVFPYADESGWDIPDKKDPAFEETGSTYSTKETTMNIYGTFDFLDLGGNENTVRSSLEDLDDNGSLDEYALNISSSEDSADSDGVTWTLENSLFSEEDGSRYGFYDSGDDVDDLRVFYNEDDEYFSFILRDQEIPEDGSPVVYNFTVTSNGATSTYRIEVVYLRTVYNVIRPLPEKTTLNQNFVEVVISSDTADSVTVDKEEAVKVEYDADLDGDVDYPNAFRAVVTGLKANKETKINIVVKEGDDELKETITVKYVPTNIPGAQFMAEMAKTHKVFDGALSLTFETGTSLIRRDFNIPEQLKNQVFSGHDLRFAIANKEDGVVDRHEFEVNYDDYNYLVGAGEQYFISNFPDRFAKSSPVFWIDAGIADDITTTEYDPVTQGADPYQFDFSDIPSFYERDPENELVPSKRGKLTLAYDASVAQDAGRLVTVFHFDPENREWENIGGVVDAKKHTVTIPFDRFGYYVVGKMSSSYTDIIDHAYGRDYIETIFSKGVMNPIDPSTSFGVDKKITRAEFVRAIVRAKELALNYSGELHFGDVPKTTVIDLDALWDYRFVETAARAGFVKGSQPGAFDPNSPITRQDASVIIAKALDLKLETDRAKITKDLQKYFKDYSTIDYYAQASVLAIAKKGFITGSPVDAKDESKGYNFNPGASTLRGDAAIILARVMIDQKKLPKM
ncbi:S-layer homology domain-containing protein [Paenibacillus sp. M1]|uniref:S-layer homology domain-containing protein n=1 Tax=Paenibacillus haidiansis TaxID=1574488 RepID=A0ABU7VXD8_9BACL